MPGGQGLIIYANGEEGYLRMREASADRQINREIDRLEIHQIKTLLIFSVNSRRFA